MEFLRFLVVFVFVALVSFACCSQAYNFKVGGIEGWVQHPSEDYNQWSERNRFQINDTLYFTYNKESDSILEVSKDSFDKCDVDYEKPIRKMSSGKSVYLFERSGPFYFISGNEKNCKKGQKLTVAVMSEKPSIGDAPYGAPAPEMGSPVTPVSPYEAPKARTPMDQVPKAQAPSSYAHLAPSINAQPPNGYSPVSFAPQSQSPSAPSPMAQSPKANAPVYLSPASPSPKAYPPVSHAVISPAPMSSTPKPQPLIAPSPAPIAQSVKAPKISLTPSPSIAKAITPAPSTPVEAPVGSPSDISAPATAPAKASSHVQTSSTALLFGVSLLVNKYLLGSF